MILRPACSTKQLPEQPGFSHTKKKEQKGGMEGEKEGREGGRD